MINSVTDMKVNRFAVPLTAMMLMVTACIGCERSQPNPPANPTERNNDTTGNPPGMPNDSPHTPGRPGDSDTDRSSQAEPPQDQGVARFLSLRAPKPKTWIWHPPRSTMREANWTVPGRDGQDAAELIVFYFGPTQGGPVDENINRWKNQFRKPGGEPGSVEPDIEEMTVDGMPITIAEFEGEWMPMGATSFQRNQKAIFAIVESPDGKVFIRFGGPAATVNANREDVLDMIRGLEIVDDASGGGTD